MMRAASTSETKRLGKLLRSARKRMVPALTVTAVAELLGVTRQTVTAVERGESVVSATLLGYAKLVGLPMGEWGGTGSVCRSAELGSAGMGPVPGDQE